MPDLRFFNTAHSFSLGELAEISGASIAKGVSSDTPFCNVASLEDATEKDVTAFYDKSRIGSLSFVKAGVCVTTKDMVDAFPSGTKILVADDVKKAFTKIVRAFYPKEKPTPFISDKAYISPSAKIGEGVRIDFGAYIGDNVEIGDYCDIEPNAVIKAGVVIGNECRIGANSSISYAVIGNNVLIYAGARIGEDGFGFCSGPEGHVKIPQLGRVIIGDNVEIGANTCIDRGALSDTYIASGTIIDNLVQIGHNNKIGHNCVLCGQIGLAGSCELGDFVVAGGQVGFADHLKIGSGAQIAAQSGVMRDVEPRQVVMGSPASPVKEYLRQVATLKKLAAGGKG